MRIILVSQEGTLNEERKNSAITIQTTAVENELSKAREHEVEALIDLTFFRSTRIIR